MAEQRQNHHLAVKLLEWYDKNARALPWRAVSPQRMDPYKVWLSEIMLQQTTVVTVKDYFEKFTSIWPTVEALAAAPLDDILKAWAGLGYYARARNLHKCAGVIVAEHGGRFPSAPEDLQKLPGIGPYTAGAIAAIAFGKSFAAVDGNVERVLSRLDAIEVPLPDSKPLIRERAQALMPKRRAGDFVQALMDLGATVCTPRNPTCGACPWEDQCFGKRAGIAATLPRKLPKKAVGTRRGWAFVVLREDGALLLRRRPEKGLLGSMMEVPGSVWEQTMPKTWHLPVLADWQDLDGRVEHTFTHFHLELRVLKAEGLPLTTALPGSDYRWVTADLIADEALPTVMRKVIAHAGVKMQRQKPSKP